MTYTLGAALYAVVGRILVEMLLLYEGSRNT